jgi:hypothetical protein
MSEVPRTPGPSLPAHTWVSVYPVIGSQLSVQSRVASPIIDSFWLVDMTRGFPVYFRVQVVASYIDVANRQRWAQSLAQTAADIPQNDPDRGH